MKDDPTTVPPLPGPEGESAPEGAPLTYEQVICTRMRQLPPYPFAKVDSLKQKLRQAGRDVIDMGVGNPTDPTPDPIVDKIIEAVKDKRNHRYSVAAGVLNLRKELAKYYLEEFGVKIDPESETLCTIGSKEGFSHMCLATLGPGDTVITPTPAFPIHLYSAVIAGANVIGVLGSGDDDDLLRRIHDAAASLRPRPKALILNYPHNPTARVMDLPFFTQVVRIAKRFGLMVMHDFAYGRICFDGYQAPSFLQAPGAKDVGVEFWTMSKGFNMAGWRCGYCVGNAAMVKAVTSIKKYFDYGLFQPVQIAAIIALRHCREAERKQSAIYQERRDALCEGLARLGWMIPKPRATMFAWAPLPDRYRSLGSMKFAMRLLEEADVAAAPGIGFGEDADGFLRLSVIENKARLQQAVRNIRKAFFRDD
jgi:alanine-synthesizing transaminase